jgi:putative SOS response-associated peptidase YedK
LYNVPGSKARSFVYRDCAISARWGLVPYWAKDEKIAYKYDMLECHPVSTRVNSPKNDAPDLIAPAR